MQDKAIADQKIILFQCNHYNDGNGDIGNLLDITSEVLDHFGAEKLIPYFVITATDKSATSIDDQKALLKEAVKLFTTQARFLFNTIENQVFSFVRTVSANSTQTHQFHCSSFDELIANSKPLQFAYANADAIITIPTPFPKLRKSFAPNPKTKFITITEHCGSSYPIDSYIPYRQYSNGLRRTDEQFNHFVTGVNLTTCSGLMIRELTCSKQERVFALQSITDEAYIQKLGLSYPVAYEKAQEFLETTLIVPVYLGEAQKNYLAPLFHLLLESPLVSSYKTLVFHVNKRSYDEDLFNEDYSKLHTNTPKPNIQLIVGHYFENPKDYRRLYQLYSGLGVAICSSDKVFELALSYNLYPIYPAVKWKQTMFKDLLQLVGRQTNHGLLLRAINQTNSHGLFLDLTYGEPYSSYLTADTRLSWQQEIRPILLNNSFYYKLHDKLLKFDTPFEDKAYEVLLLLQHTIKDTQWYSSSHHFFEPSSLPVEIEVLTQCVHEGFKNQKSAQAIVLDLFLKVIATDTMSLSCPKAQLFYDQIVEHLSIDIEQTARHIQNQIDGMHIPKNNQHTKELADFSCNFLQRIGFAISEKGNTSKLYHLKIALLYAKDNPYYALENNPELMANWLVLRPDSRLLSDLKGANEESETSCKK